MAKSNEPLWWAPFMAGAVVSAFLMPITIVVIGILTYCSWINDREVWHLLQNPWVRFYFFVLIALSLFHGFHRILYVLIDLGLKNYRNTLAVLCYGCAIGGTIVALLLVLRVFPQPTQTPPPADSASVGSAREWAQFPLR
jgi:fumarate reductase subunit D